MGRTIQAESRTVELVAVRCAYEFEPSVLEYWDQPCRIELCYQSGTGRSVKVKHTPDFFVLREDRIGWEEWKPATQMGQLVHKMPNRYKQQPDGSWICPPGVAAAAEYGFYYVVRTETEFGEIYQRNVAILEDYLLQTGTRADEIARQEIVAIVASQPGVTLTELQGQFINDDLLAVIAKRDIYTHLKTVALVNAEQVQLFPSTMSLMMRQKVTPDHHHREQIAKLQPGTILLWDERPWYVVNNGIERIAIQSADDRKQLVDLSRPELVQLVAQQCVSLPSPAHDAVRDVTAERIRQASPVALERAVARVEIVKAHLAGETVASGYAARTVRRYVRRYLAAKAQYGSGLLGVFDDNHLKGNRRTRLSAESVRLMEDSIRDGYETLKQKSIQHVYNEYVRICDTQQVEAASYTTFAGRVKQRPQAEQVRKRQGERAAYQTGPQNWWLTYSIPRHGDFPWQLCHIDHTQLNRRTCRRSCAVCECGNCVTSTTPN
ncbi:MAG: Tn7 transposase TnsA N-terminal domain-containing protein [Anaerolineae bacterium]|nr:Tn7 transposase TnsA N-terminal domain-containing protein [Anaerolineae bacterium]MCO5206196.1 Tn7 transposase TnsA N-terminal domain-containing protein [Anaerolineae bacterium]